MFVMIFVILVMLSVQGKLLYPIQHGIFTKIYCCMINSFLEPHMDLCVLVSFLTFMSETGFSISGILLCCS